MIKGVLIGFGIIIVLIPIPIVHIITIPFGPFIGGYYGISAAGGNPASPGRNALVFGAWTGVLTLVMAVIVMGTIDYIFYIARVLQLILWGIVVAVPFYYGSMAGLGAWYSELTAIAKA